MNKEDGDLLDRPDLFYIVTVAVFDIAVSAVLKIWGLSLMWGWFVVPLGAPQIGLAHLFGLSILISFLVHGLPRGSKEDAGEFTKAPMVKTIGHAAAVLTVIGIGALVHAAM